MSYTTNKYNYATPLSSSTGLFGENTVVTDRKYFTLSDNVLDGSYSVISGDVGLWDSILPNSDGTLSQPFVLTITENLSISAFKLSASQYNYPVDFTVVFKNGTNILDTLTVTGNTTPEYLIYFDETLVATEITVTVTKISSASSVARLFNVYTPFHLKRKDILHAYTTESSSLSIVLYANFSDTLKLKATDSTKAFGVDTKRTDTLNIGVAEHNDNMLITTVTNDAVKLKHMNKSAIRNTIDLTTDKLHVKYNSMTHITNTIDKTVDTVRMKFNEARTHVTNIIDPTFDTLKGKTFGKGEVLNVHTLMKRPFRQIFGKVYITYTDPMLDEDITIGATSEAYNSNSAQIFDSITEAERKYFTLYDNDLSGSYHVSNDTSQVGWVSKVVSDASGNFSSPQVLTVHVPTRPIVSVVIAFDELHNNIAKDFDVVVTQSNGVVLTYPVRNNTDAKVHVTDSGIAEVDSVDVVIYSVNRPSAPAQILDLSVSSTALYKGYANESNVMSIDLLEELTYEDEIEALGGVSANEITVILDNSNRDFFFNSDSLVSKQLKRNRKIVAWLGVEIVQGEIEWYTLGTFWSYKWDVPVNGLTATVTGFDTIGLLSITDYKNHQTQINKSLGYLIEYVLEDAKTRLGFIEYDIDDSLYDVIIPYAWFEASSHAAALRKISSCYPMHIYCDRKGIICAKPQKLHFDYYYDIWAESTNIIDTKYSSLYTTLPNIVTVNVHIPVLIYNDKLVQEENPFVVSGAVKKTLNFRMPYVSDMLLSVDCDDTISYTYSVYSWGIEIDFTGEGQVYSMNCVGTGVDISASSVLSRSDEVSVHQNGAVKREVSSDFIQTNDLAKYIIDRLFSLSEQDKYDATVQYRGDISVSINDPIILNESIAPDNRYNIKRHQLTWNGGLTGSAELNT